MKKKHELTEVYSSITKPELVFGISHDSLFVLAIFFMLFIFIKQFSGISILWLFPSVATIYALLFITAKVDSFYFAISNLKNKLRTKQHSKNKGNLYVS